MEKYYIFRKKCKVSDTKLRRHLRLINAGKKSKVFEPQSDDEDEDDEHVHSMAFFNEFSKEENTKKLLETVERENEFEERIQIALLERSGEQEKLVQERIQIEVAKITDELKKQIDNRVRLTVEKKMEKNKENVQELIDLALNSERETIRKEEVERILSSTKKHMETEMSKISVFKKTETTNVIEPESSISSPKMKKRKIESSVVLNKFAKLPKQEQNYDEIYVEGLESYQPEMEEEYIENDEHENSNIFTITVNEDDNNDESIVVQAKTNKSEIVIPDEADPEEIEEEMDYEDYESEHSNKDNDVDEEPDDLESITKAVKVFFIYLFF